MKGYDIENIELSEQIPVGMCTNVSYSLGPGCEDKTMDIGEAKGA